MTPGTESAVSQRPLPVLALTGTAVILEAPPSCLLPSAPPPSLRSPKPSPSTPDPSKIAFPEFHAACGTYLELRVSCTVLGFSRNPAPVLVVILFNWFLQKKQDLLFLTPADLPAPYHSEAFLLITLTSEFRPSHLHFFICPVTAPSVLLNPSFSDGTTEVPKADAPCPAAHVNRTVRARGLTLRCPGSQEQTLFCGGEPSAPSSLL